MLKNVIIAVLTLMAAFEMLMLLSLLEPSTPAPTARDIAYSDFVHEVDAGQVSQVSIQGSELKGVTTDDQRFQTHLPEDSTLIPNLVSKNVRVLALPTTEQASALHFILSWVPILLLTSVWGWYMSRIARAILSINATMKTLVTKSPTLDQP